MTSARGQPGLRVVGGRDPAPSDPMLRHRVLVNDRLLFLNRTGVGQYLAMVMAHWPARSSVQLQGFCSRRCKNLKVSLARFAFPPLADLPPVRRRPLSALEAHARHTGRFKSIAKSAGRWLYDRMLAREWRRGDYTCFFEPNHVVGLSVAPTITTICDLSVLETPQFHPADRLAYWRREFDKTVATTTAWIAISAATRDAMVRRLGLSSRNIHVIPLASRWPTVPDDWSPAAVRRQLGLPDRYFAYLGTLEPRKNLTTLLDAYAQLPATFRRYAPLVLAGMPGWGDANFWRLLCEHPIAGDVLWTGYVTDAQAAALVRGALALAYPSLYEGFGLPALEAMALEVPVVASRIPSLEEVCGDAAILVEPTDVRAWTSALERIGEHDLLRERLRQQGARQAARFSWESTALLHHDVFVGLDVARHRLAA